MKSKQVTFKATPFSNTAIFGNNSQVSFRGPELLSLFQRVAAMRPNGPERKNEVKRWTRGSEWPESIHNTSSYNLVLYLSCRILILPPHRLYCTTLWDQLIGCTSLHPWHTVLLPQVMSSPAPQHGLFELTLR